MLDAFDYCICRSRDVAARDSHADRVAGKFVPVSYGPSVRLPVADVSNPIFLRISTQHGHQIFDNLAREVDTDRGSRGFTSRIAHTVGGEAKKV